MKSQTINCTQENAFKVIHCKNSEALKIGKTDKRYEIKKCEFCNQELEVTGFYIQGGFPKTWISRGEYERCTCKKAQGYWKNFDEKESQKKIREEQDKREKEYQERLERLMIKSNLGARFKNRTFATFEVTDKNKKAYEDCKRYANKFKELKDDGIGIIINGSYGAGKTHLAAAVAHELMKQGFQPIFGTLINLLDKIRATYDDFDSKVTENQIINSYINCSLLIIDDIGKEKPSEWTLQKLYQVLNERYENNNPVIITSNYDIEKLKERLTVNGNFETAEAIISRIYEMCKGINLQCEDYRKK
jgi:DNA replication protein DnaC